MAKKESSFSKIRGQIKDEALQGIIAIILGVLALFLILAAFGKGGPAGIKAYSLFSYLLGVGYIFLPISFAMLSYSFFRSFERKFKFLKIIGVLLFLFSSLGITSIVAFERGGVVGKLISKPVLYFFDIYAGTIILAALGVISLFIIFNRSVSLEQMMFWRWFGSGKKNRIKVRAGDDEKIITLDDASEVPADKDEDETDKLVEPKIAPEEKTKKKLERDGDDDFSIKPSLYRGEPYEPPPVSLLERDKGKPVVGDIKANANIIKRTLQNFGIQVEMDEVSIGPSVTRYALKPAEGVKLSRIVGLQNDLALALAAHPIRIEAPIPGKSLVGIEIPNTTKATVGLGNLVSTEEFIESDKALMLTLGKGVSGKSHYGNLAKMPHLLIAGATGSGKSVTIHALITSLLFRNSPENLKFIMIDPKRVELTLYNKIPHLLTPVITDAKKAILALKWAAKEMDRRYDILESESVRDIESYHKNILTEAVKDSTEGAETPETMPYIVVVIDELADIMQTYPRELEAAIVRLAQMSRAVGIHLILSTQRPSVNVITGLIKANIPSRIALQVASQVDSRTILDCAGAEKLLGAGDMLYLSGEMSKPQRIQSAFISENEVKKVVSHLARNYKDSIPQDISLTSAETEKNPIFDESLSDETLEDDPLYEDARQVVIEAGKASTSYIQRKLRVGYSRAARLMDMLEERGVIGSADGSRPRDVINSSSSPSQDEETAQ